MSDQPKGPAEAWDDERVLLATKLYIPPEGPSFVVRRRLVAQIAEQVNNGFILVSAPAGFGKTSLLAEWARGGDQPVAWLSLDTGDNDPLRFWRHVVAAIEGAVPGALTTIDPGGPGSSRALDAWLTAFINALATEREAEVALILDDYHVIETRAVHDTVRFLLDHLPPGLQVVLASRADPPLPLALMRSRGQLVEVRADDLRFTPEEAADLLLGVVGSPLSSDAVAALASRTEGWVAGLQLAALSLQGRSDASDFVATFSGSHRFVLDYLTEEVLDRHPAPLREFLYETSILERLSGDLCDAVTGHSDGQQSLEALERANLFLVPLDDDREWWRYHHLFADMLRARLEQEQPERVRDLHLKAAVWHDESGLANDAVHHALAAEDFTLAAQLMERQADRLDRRGEGATMQRWLAALPAEVVASRPRLLLSQVRSALFSGDVDRADALLDAAENAMARRDVDDSGVLSVDRAASLLANLPAAIALDRAYLAALRGDADAAIGFARDGRAQIGEGEWRLDALASLYLGLAAWLHGRLGDAEDALSSCIAQWRAADEPTLIAYGCHDLGRVQQAQGQLGAALETYEQTLQITTTAGQTALPAEGVAHLGMAEVAYQRDDLDASQRHVSRGIDLTRRLDYDRMLAPGLVTLAWIRQATGDEAGALQAMDKAEQVAPGPEVVDLLNPVPTQHARLLLAQGDVAAAAEWIANRDLEVEDEALYFCEPAHLLVARLLLAQEQPEKALQLLDRLDDAAVAQHRFGSVIEIQVLRALAFAACGDEPNAFTAVDGALAHARSEGHVRVFADEGPPMRDLLDAYLTRQVTDETDPTDPSLQLVGRISDAFEGGDPETPPFGLGAKTLVVPLTERESEVLELLAAGKTNREIAGELYVGVDTVKKHLTHIFDKLGVSNRTEAAARARELGLIS